MCVCVRVCVCVCVYIYIYIGKQNTPLEATTGHAGAGLALNMEACANYRSSKAGSNLSAPSLAQKNICNHTQNTILWWLANIKRPSDVYLHLVTLLHCYHEFWCHVWGQGKYTLNGGVGQYALWILNNTAAWTQRNFMCANLQCSVHLKYVLTSKSNFFFFGTDVAARIWQRKTNIYF